MSTRPPRYLAALLVVLLIPVGVAWAGPRSAFPEWKGERVHAPRGGGYDALDAYVTVLERTSKQRYTVVVVKSSGSGSWATRNYCDELYRHWIRRHATAGRLIHERHVLIVLALENRQLAVRASPLLQKSYGLRGQAVDQKYVRPHFISYAKAGRYAEGLQKLIGELDRSVTAMDRRVATHAARAKQHRDAKIAKTKQVIEELTGAVAAVEGRVQKEQTSGYELGSLTQKLARAKGILAKARQEVEQNPTAASQDTISARRAVSEVVEALEQLDHAAEELPARFEAQGTRMQLLEAKLEAAHAEELSVAPLRERLDALEASFAEARESQARNPLRAIALLHQGDRALTELFDALERLEQERDAWRAAREDVAQRLTGFEQSLDRAREDGVDVADLAASAKRVREAVDSSRTESRTSYHAERRELQELAGTLDSLRAEMEEEQAKHRFWSEDVPRYAVIGLAVLLALFVFIRLLVRWTRKRRVVRRMERFDAKRASVEEQLHALRETHRQLLLTDPDYTVSLRGTTRRVYDEIGEAFNAFRRQWRTLGGHWDDARDLVERQGLFGWKKLDEAFTHLGAHPPPVLDPAIREQVEAPLALLDSGPENARSAHAALERDVDAIEAAVAEVAAAGLSTFAYADRQGALKRLLADATKELRHDPLGVSERVADGRADGAALVERTRKVVENLRRAQALEAAEQAAATAHSERVAEGFLFVEDGSDPLPALALARQERERGVSALNAGDPAGASTALDQSEAASSAAAKAIHDQVEGKRICAEELALRRADVTRLSALLDSTRPHAAVLAAEFAEASWEEVADAIELGEETLATCTTKLDEAEAASTPTRQHYAQGGRLVRETQAAQELLEAGLMRVEALRGELEAKRDECRAELARLEQERQRVGTWLESETRDRPPANQRFALAGRHLERGTKQAAAAQPDWLVIGALLAGVAKGFGRAEELAQADMRLAAAAAAELREAHDQIESADGFYGYGINADLDDARARLELAQGSFLEQEYEEAVFLANDAEQAAEEAAADARARERARRRAARRRTMSESSNSSGYSIFGSGMGSSSSSGSSSSGFGSFGGSSSGTSQSSWGSSSSGTSQSSW